VAYPTHTAIKVILDNHSAHISKETRGWLAAQRSGRFEFVFTPTHGSWLNLVEGFFSKLGRSGCATSVSHPSRNSRIASWAQSSSSIISLSSTLGPTCCMAQPDMFRSKETMY
jgi:transposase